MVVVLNVKGTSVPSFQIGKQGPIVKNDASVIAIRDKDDASDASLTADSITLGAATGGDQGAGTLNAAGLFIDGVAVGSGSLANVVEDTTPQLGGQLDINGFAIGNGTEELLKFVEIVSAVNEITITNAATGNNPRITASGNNATVGIDIRSKGTGSINFDTASGSNRQVQILNTASAVNNLTLTGSATGGNPTIAVVGTDTNISIKLEPKGNGEVIIGPAVAATASIQAEDDQDLVVKGGDSVAAAAGDLIIEGGDGTGGFASGNVEIRGGAGGSGAGTVIIDSTEFALPVGGGITVGLATGGNQGSGTVNATAYFINGVELTTPQVSFNSDTFTGTGLQVAFTLSNTPANEDAILVAVSGLVQDGGVDFTVSGTTLTFTTAPPNGAKILVLFRDVVILSDNSVTTKTGAYTTVAGDDVVLADSTSTGFTITLGSAAAVISGNQITIKDSGGNSATNNITIDTEAAETIDGAASIILTNDYESYTFISDGTNWFINGHVFPADFGSV